MESNKESGLSIRYLAIFMQMFSVCFDFTNVYTFVSYCVMFIVAVVRSRRQLLRIGRGEDVKHQATIVYILGTTLIKYECN